MKRPCLERGCRALTTETRCEEHRRAKQRVRQAERDPAEKGLYGSSAWQRLRRLVLEEAGFQCEVLVFGSYGQPPEPCRENATSVDHIRPIRQYPELALDIENCRASCARHQRVARDHPPGAVLPR